MVEEEAVAEVLDAEEVVAAEVMVQEAADAEEPVEGRVEEEAEEEAEEEVETLDAEEGPVIEEIVVELSDGEAPAVESMHTALVKVSSATRPIPASVATAPIGRSPFTPRRPGGIRIHSVSVCFFGTCFFHNCAVCFLIGAFASSLPGRHCPRLWPL